MPKVLVVDDEWMILDLLGEFLKGEGYEVESALNWSEALAKLESGSPNIVLLDLKLGEEDGRGVLKQIRTKDPKLPVVMMSGIVDEDYWNEVKALGAVEHLVKPFELEQLKVLIENVLKRNLD